MKKVLIIGIALAVLIAGVLYFTRDDGLGAESSAGPEIDYASDVIGTRVGTTTAGVYFLNTAASSTYRVGVGGADEATFTVLPTIASSTGAIAHFTFWGSNDFDCTTSSTTGGSLNPILTTDINWYDIGDHVDNLAGTQSLSATSTVAMTIYQGLGKDIVLSNLNYQCIKISAHASSTYLLMQARLKN